MRFTGKNLIMVRRGIYYALSDIHSHIGGCPDVVYFAEELEEYEAEKLHFERLLTRIDAAIDKEETTP